LKWLWTAVVLYVLGAVGDNLLTYRYVVVEHRFVEANPFVAPRVYSQPLWLWFVYDFVALAITFAITFGCYKLIVWLSRNDPPMRRARVLRIASKYWTIVMVAGVVRFMPVVHNLLLLCFGYESPLSVMIFELGKYMGVAP